MLEALITDCEFVGGTEEGKGTDWTICLSHFRTIHPINFRILLEEYQDNKNQKYNIPISLSPDLSVESANFAGGTKEDRGIIQSD